MDETPKSRVLAPIDKSWFGFVHYFFSLNSIMFMLPKIAAAGRMVSRVNGFGKFTRCFSQITVRIYESL